MTRPTLEFHPQAYEEVEAAKQWYASHSPAVADAFLDELDHAVERILEAPDRWAAYLHGTRRYLLRRFPYLVVYRETPRAVQVLAVAHARRRPGYWKSRTTP